MTMRLVAVPETRKSIPAPWARRLASLALSVFVLGLVAHRFGFLATPAFFLVLWMAAIMAGLALVLVVLAMPKVWYRGYRGGRHLIGATFFSCLVLAPILAALAYAASQPALTDISTDLDDPPPFIEAAKLHTPDMNPLLTASDIWKAEQSDAYPKVGGRRYEIPIESVRESVEKVFEARGWEQLGPYLVGTATEFEIETTVYSPVLALPSDVVVRLIGDDDATYVDMRVASRYGWTDFGANADLVMSYLNDLDVAVSSTATAPAAQ